MTQEEIVESVAQDDAEFKKNEETVKKGFFTKVKETAGKVPFVQDAVAMYFCAMDPNTPLYARGIAYGALAYFVVPLDVIADLLAGLGYTDDAAIIAAALAALAKNITPEHRQKAADWLAGNKPA